MKHILFFLLIILTIFSCKKNEEVFKEFMILSIPPDPINLGWEYLTQNEFPKIDHGYSNEISKIYFVNQNVGFATGSTSILQTTDQGETWSEVLDFNSYIFVEYTQDSIYIIDQGSFRKCSNTAISMGQSFLLPEGFFYVSEFTVLTNNITIKGYGKSFEYITLTSSDYGQNWNRVLTGYITGCPSTCFIESISISYNSNILVTVTNGYFEDYGAHKDRNLLSVTEYYSIPDSSITSFRNLDFYFKTYCIHDGKLFLGGRYNKNYYILKKEL